MEVLFGALAGTADSLSAPIMLEVCRALFWFLIPKILTYRGIINIDDVMA